MIYKLFFPVVWGSFVAYWCIAALWVRKIRISEPRLMRVAYLALAAVAWGMLRARDSWLRRLDARLWPMNGTPFFVGAAFLLIGLGFAVWARVHLGQFWSASVAVKEDHQLIRSGPYALVRHPIYTGILTGVLGTAIAVGQTGGLVALAVLGCGFLWKSRREERLMIQTFGDRYVRYIQEVPALVPFLHR